MRQPGSSDWPFSMRAGSVEPPTRKPCPTRQRVEICVQPRSARRHLECRTARQRGLEMECRLQRALHREGLSPGLICPRVELGEKQQPEKRARERHVRLAVTQKSRYRVPLKPSTSRAKSAAGANLARTLSRARHRKPILLQSAHAPRCLNRHAVACDAEPALETPLILCCDIAVSFVQASRHNPGATHEV